MKRRVKGEERPARRAAPEPAHGPLGDRPTYAPVEGLA